jgi:hypothetical protein
MSRYTRGSMQRCQAHEDLFIGPDLSVASHGAVQFSTPYGHVN